MTEHLHPGFSAIVRALVCICVCVYLSRDQHLTSSHPRRQSAVRSRRRERKLSDIKNALLASSRAYEIVRRLA